MLTEVDLTILLRATLAALLGFVIGGERRAVGAPIRARTMALAAMTAAALVALTEGLYPDETARVVAGIVTGIGFLGAGAILRSASGEVRGLTTAASLWAMSAIGLAVGSGHELLGVLLTLVAYFVMACSEWPLVSRLMQRRAKNQAEAAGTQPCGESPPESDASEEASARS
jgi:putative Mg2+ transporter-C (MgtC) family protein